jgi:hypothetical protein
MRRSVQSRSIGAPGRSRTSSSRPTSRHLLRREMRRTSTCQVAPARRSSTPPKSFRSTLGHPSSTSPRRSPIKPATGQARCFRKSPKHHPTNPTTTEPHRHQRESRQPRSNQRKRKRKIVVCLGAARSMSLQDDAGRRPRQNAKICANRSAGREGRGNTTVGGQDKRPRGAARLGDGRGIVLASVFIVAPRCEPQLCSPHTRQFRNLFNENHTSRDVWP